MIPINYIFVADTVIDPDQVNDNFFQLSSRAMSVPLTESLQFQPDNTWDIGAAAAGRPRDLFLGRNAVIGGTTVLMGLVQTSGGAQIGGPLTAYGVTTLYGTLSVVGAATLNATTVSGTLDVSAVANFHQPVNIYNTLGVSGLLTAHAGITIFNAPLTVHTHGQFNATLSVAGAAYVGGTIMLGGIVYAWPGTQSAGTVLTTNGAGVLAWVSPSTGPFAPTAHATTHNTGGSDPVTSLAATVLTSGIVAPDRMGTGATGLNFLRSDNTWQVVTMSPVVTPVNFSQAIDNGGAPAGPWTYATGVTVTPGKSYFVTNINSHQLRVVINATTFTILPPITFGNLPTTLNITGWLVSWG